MNPIKLRYEIENIYNLPTIPSMLRKLLLLIEDPSISMPDLGNFILKDPALASRIMKAANSPIYGFQHRIKNISQALMMLGSNSVKGLLLGISVFDIMERTMAGLWQHSAGCAAAAKVIAEQTGHKGIAEDVAVAALLHDIGKVIFGLRYSEEYQHILAVVREKNSTLFQEEKEHFGVTHADVGSWLAYKWNFPQILVETIKYHHSPSLSRTAPIHTSIVNLADIIVKTLGFGFSGDDLTPMLYPQVLQVLAIDKELLKSLVFKIDSELGEPADFEID